MKAARGRASGSWEVAWIMRRAGVPMVQDEVCVAGFRRRTDAALQDRCKMAARWAGLRGRLVCAVWARTLFGAFTASRVTSRAALGSGAPPVERCRAAPRCERTTEMREQPVCEPT